MKRLLSALALGLAAVILAAGPSSGAPLSPAQSTGLREAQANALVQPVHKRWRRHGYRYVAPYYGYGAYYGYRPRYYAPYAYYYPAPRYYGYYTPSYGYYYSRKHRDWDDDDWDDD